jgi:hypothetical protein
MKQEQVYGSINEDTIHPDEETALISGNTNDDAVVVEVATARNPTRKAIVSVLLVVAAFVALMSSDISPFSAQAAAADGGAAAPFDWKSWGADIKTFWAEKKAYVHVC